VVDAQPFRALRYDPAVAGDALSTSAPPYDDVGRFTYARHRTASPYTVLELLTPGETTSGSAYAGAAAAFRRWLRTGVLRSDDRPAFYLYEIHELRRGVPAVMRGVLAAVSVTDATLRPHEDTDPQRVTARLQRLQAVPADLAPVFAVHTPAPASLRRILDAPPRSAPIVAVTDETGADHRIWALADRGEVEAVAAGIAQVEAVIADGHHRYQAAVALHDQDPSLDRTMVYLVDGSAYGPQLQAVHRRVDGLSVTPRVVLGDRFAVYPVPSDGLADALDGHEGFAFGLRHGGSTSLVVARDPKAIDATLPVERRALWQGLDSAAWEYAVRPLLGPVEVSYRSDVDAAAAGVDPDPAAALFVLRSPSLAQVHRCAHAGVAMPPKTTWFWPKPRAGLVMRSLQSVDGH